MGGRLIGHMKANDYENKKDAVGRRTGAFYMNYCRQVNEAGLNPSFAEKVASHGFKF